MGGAETPNNLTESYTKGFNFDERNQGVTAFAILYATRVGHRAYEYTEKRQGYFTWAIVEGLKGEAANEKGEVTLAGLVSYIQNTVPKRVGINLGIEKDQEPWTDIKGFKAEELVIAISPRQPVVSASGPAQPPAVDPGLVELNFWRRIKNSNAPNDFEERT